MRWFWLLIGWIGLVALVRSWSYQAAYVIVIATIALLIWAALLNASERQVRRTRR